MFPSPKKLKINKKLLIFCFLTLSLTFLFSFLNPLKVYAKDECKDISDKDDQIECYAKKEQETQNKLNTTKSKINSTLDSINQLSSQLNVTQSQLSEVQNNIDETKKELDLINENLEDRNLKLSEKIKFRNNLLRNYSKKNIISDLEILFAKNENVDLTGFELSTFLYAFNKATSEETLKIIGALNSEIRQFEENKKESEELKKDLELAQNNLIALKNDLATKKTSEEGEYKELEEKKVGYEQELEKLQDQILSLKYGDEYGTVGDYEEIVKKTPDPSFSSRPAFAAFSFGAYTHYNGMSQYGARGRAQDGQGYEKILKFYYKVGLKSEWSEDKKKMINVQGHGEMSYQHYLYGIAEMPSDWPLDALKAQAIAARTYAYRSNKPICTTQACQVFNETKAKDVENGKYSNWKKAVDETKGKILDNPTTSQYSSTTGGYLNQAGWDAKGDDRFESWQDGNAYEKRGGSPWFYKAWYTKSYNNNSNCGRSSPWLTEKEMADILNSWVVYKYGSSDEKAHITPVTKDCWGGDPYSLDKMAEKAGKYSDKTYGGKYTSVSNVSVKTSENTGKTATVYFETNKGSVSMDGSTFQKVFNLRAPGYISLRSGLFDIQIKK